jgi:uncharacterized protein
MSLFLLTFFVLYGCMHAHLFIKARAAFSFGLPVMVPLAVFMAIMVCGPVIVRVSERSGLEWIAIPMAYGAYLWMGFLFLFFIASLVLDICALLVYLGSLAAGKGASIIAGTGKICFCASALAAGLVVCYGFVEAENIKTGHVVIKTDKLPKEVGALRIVQISDLHLGLTTRDKWLRGVVDRAQKLKPDILVSTGDLLDGDSDSLKGAASMFREIVPRYGKFAITGNHEFYAGIQNFTRFAEDAGFRVIRGEGVSIEGVINVAGVDDIAGKPFHLYGGVEERTLLKSLPGSRFTLLLKHRPVVDPMAVGSFDLQLSGHTHKGQIFPFNYVVKRFFPFIAGQFDLGNGSALYVSRGTGTWGPPIRFLSPPEITLVEIRAYP